MPGFRVELDDVTYYPSVLSAKPVLDRVNLHIEPGEFVAVIGLNGAGKSTLLRAISGEIVPTAGTVRVGGQLVTEPINRVIDGVGVVHQADDPDLIDHLTVAQNIAIRQILGGGHPNRVFSSTPTWSRRVATTLASEADLPGFDLNELILDMNGGRRQVLSVAIAIHFEHHLNPCRLLLLDEHTSRLDHRNAVSVMAYTAEQAKRAAATVVMVTHRYQNVMQFASRAIIMREGAVWRSLRVADINSLDHLVQIVEGEAA